MQDSKKRIYIFFLVLVLIILGILGFYFLFYKNSISKNEKELSFIKLKEDPEYLERENLVKINGEYLLEYFRQRLIFHNYSTKKKGKSGFILELEKDFPGERSRVLVSILEKFLEFEEKKKEINIDKKLDSFEKIEKINLTQIEIFGEKLSIILFPKKDSEKIEKFYEYADRYLKKHFFDLTRKKEIHLEKAKKEIYGEDFGKLISLEPAKKKLELDIQIHERELSILNDEEKKIAIENLKTKKIEYSK